MYIYAIQISKLSVLDTLRVSIFTVDLKYGILSRLTIWHVWPEHQPKQRLLEAPSFFFFFRTPSSSCPNGPAQGQQIA